MWFKWWKRLFVGSHGSWSNRGEKGELVSRQRRTFTRFVLKLAYQFFTQSVLLFSKGIRFRKRDYRGYLSFDVLKVAKYDRRNRETTLSAEASADGSKREG